MNKTGLEAEKELENFHSIIYQAFQRYQYTRYHTTIHLHKFDLIGIR